MATVKLQLYKDTSVKRGYGDRGLDRVIIVGIVYGVSHSNSSISEAVAQAVSAAGANATTFGISDLELADGEGYRLTDEAIWVVLTYARLPGSVPVVPATSNVTERGDWEWDYDVAIGTFSVNGTTYNWPYTKKGVANLSKFYMNTVLDTHPGTVIDNLAGKVNHASYSIGGRTFAAEEVRFDSPNITPIHRLSGTTTTTITKYDVTYELTRKEGGWYRFTYGPIINFGVGATGVSYTFGSTRRYGTANFSTIPVHA